MSVLTGIAVLKGWWFYGDITIQPYSTTDCIVIIIRALQYHVYFWCISNNMQAEN